ncbi:hypothetical protein [Alloprevotella tannerae]|uniref:hypothetical protein n=1 Tax=Alloprevotella tannerae TaxID=76122 RepID=UPI0028EF12A8|nr:hypothetical protein [Alloprevotella tannerae]
MGQSGFSSFYQLLNIRLMLRKWIFLTTEWRRCIARKLPSEARQKAYSGLYKREFTEEDSEIRIIKDEKKRSLLTINGLPIADGCEQKWKQLINRKCLHRL